MPLEIRQMIVKSIVQKQSDDVVHREQKIEFDDFRGELLEECRRIIAEEQKSKEER